MASQLFNEDYGIPKINWHSPTVGLCIFFHTLTDLNPDSLLKYDASGLIAFRFKIVFRPFSDIVKSKF